MKIELSSKGQVIFPETIRDRKGRTVGCELPVDDLGDGIMLRLVGGVPATTLDEVIGCTGYKGPRRSLADMEAGIARGVQAGK
jgi:bifunctional DNA-binding transcriptional regulator/antitoxin component of YhaV-PrlF toxin-antitoxin module